MLKRLRDLENWRIDASDGQDVGHITDFYFDDDRWTVRYIVASTGGWLTGRSVLISPMAVERMDWSGSRLELSLDRDRIKNAPDADAQAPLPRGWEATYAGYYGYPYYWVGPGLWGASPTPAMAQSAVAAARAQEAEMASPDAQHLRAVREVSGYHIAARDGEIGHVEGFLFDEDNWNIRYLIVDTSNWIGGHTVLVSPDWADRIEWARQQVHVDVTREDVKGSPEYHPGAEIDRAYEERLAKVYRHPVTPR